MLPAAESEYDSAVAKYIQVCLSVCLCSVRVSLSQVFGLHVLLMVLCRVAVDEVCDERESGRQG